MAAEANPLRRPSWATELGHPACGGDELVASACATMALPREGRWWPGMLLTACEVVIPTVSGRTRLPWTPNKVPDWETAGAYLFGGISPVAVGVIGKWRNPAAPPGQGIVPDPQNRYEIAVAHECVAELREFMRFTCVHFEQECLYFKVRGTVEFLDNPLGWP